eukprot:scaffold20654_cov19-Prasinocladus_malaysianus.AAC.2
MKICTTTAIDFKIMDIVIISAKDIDNIDIDDAVDVAISTSRCCITTRRKWPTGRKLRHRQTRSLAQMATCSVTSDSA